MIRQAIHIFNINGVVTLFFLGTLFSCGKDSSCLKGTGKQTIETRQIYNVINDIVLRDNINLVLTQDSITSIKVEGGRNLLPYIKTKVRGNNIEITNENRCNFLRSYDHPITVYLSMPMIQLIDYTGHGDVSTTNTFNLDSLIIDIKNGTGSLNININAVHLGIIQHTGPADFKVGGETGNLFVYTSGNGKFHLENLVANSGHIANHGTGDINVHVKDNLIIELSSLGNIIYFGNPVLDVREHSGKGKIIRK